MQRLTLPTLLVFAICCTAQGAAVFGIYDRPFSTTGQYGVASAFASQQQVDLFDPDGLWLGTAPAYETSPVQGTEMGVLGYGSNSITGNAPVSFIETSLGLTQTAGAVLGTIDSMLLNAANYREAGGPFVAFNGSALWQTVSVLAGDVWHQKLNFISGEYLPFDDFAFYSISQGGATTMAGVLNRTINVDTTQLGATQNLLPEGVGDQGWSGWYDFNYTFATAGTYTIGLGLVNVGWIDPATVPPNPGELLNDSTLLIDPVPEPTTMLLGGAALLALAAYGKRRKANA